MGIAAERAAHFQYVDNPLASFLSVYPDLLPGKSRSAGEMLAAWSFSTSRTLRNQDSEGTWTLPVKTQALRPSISLCGWTRRKDSFNKQVKKVTSYCLLIWLLTLNCKALVLRRDVKNLLEGEWVLSSNCLVQRSSTLKSALKTGEEHQLFQT